MHRIILVAFSAAATLAACDGGHGTEADADADVADTMGDTLDDTAADPDVAPDVAVDTSPDTSMDTGEEEVTAVCGNMEVEPGEDCDPPGLNARCTTTCGTIGEGVCTSGCQQAAPEDCVPPEERCNLVDDDCDTLVDEGAMAAWETRPVLSTEASLVPSTVDLASAQDGYAAIWVVAPGGGSPDEIHLSVTDALGQVLLDDATLALTGMDKVLGRPALAFQGSDLLVAFLSPSTGRNVARVRLDGEVVSQTSTGATSPGDGLDLAWCQTRGWLGWIEEVGGDQEVYLVQVDGDGLDVGSPVRITEAAGEASQVQVDCAVSGDVASAWIDSRDGSDQVHRVVLDATGALLASDAAVTTAGGAGSPAISADHRLVTFVDDRDSVAKAWAVALDGDWEPLGPATELAEAESGVLQSDARLIALGAGETLMTLGVDGAAEDTSVATELTPIRSVALGLPTMAAAGADASSDLVMSLTGCADMESCTSWTTSTEAVESRAGVDEVARFVGHDGAIEGSFEERPVSYISIQIFQGAPYSGPTSPGGYLLTGENYQDCGVCVLLMQGCGPVSCDAVYLARAGKLIIEQIGGEGDTFAGTLTNAQLAEIDLDLGDRSSTWVDDGLEICLGEYSFSAVLDPI